jgi:tRNA (guanine37-N1)-methyltransferase
MPAKKKDAAMSAFASGEADILVATTVVEVGVDVPNAALIIIENADRFGLSQLHQLRGRVGRGKHESFCVLFRTEVPTGRGGFRMKIKILTLFPEIYDALKSGIVGKALDNGLFSVEIVNIRPYSQDKHKKVDDYPYGGGAGMVMSAQPIHDAIIASDPSHTAKRIYLSPKGERLNQNIVKDLAKCDEILLLAGSYEGIDQRVIDTDIDYELSIGDYILTSGDIAALAVVNAVSRLIPGVLGSELSPQDESFENNLLEYPHYTRPAVWNEIAVPDILLSGDHAQIAKYRAEESLRITKERRLDLIWKH